MAYTRHGHHVHGTPTDDLNRAVARCGGPGLCPSCSRDAAPYLQERSDPNTYQSKVKQIKAWKLTPEDADSIAMMVGGQLVNEIDPGNPENKFVGLNYPTLDGSGRVSEGDYLVMLPNGRYKTMSAVEFESNYEQG